MGERGPLPKSADVLNLFGSRVAPARSLDQEFKPEVVGISIRNIDNVVPQRLSCHLGEIGTMIGVVRELSKAVNAVRKTSNTALVDEVLHHGLSAMEKKYLKKK